MKTLFALMLVMSCLPLKAGNEARLYAARVVYDMDYIWNQQQTSPNLKRKQTRF